HGIEDSRLRLARDGMEIHADGAQGRGALFYRPDTAAPDVFDDLITTLVLFLVAQAGGSPPRASAVMLGPTALILAGRSGAGKSSLALAADRRGLAVLSDDTVYVQTQPRLRLWAWPRAIHVFEKDAPSGASGTMRYRSG